MLDPHFLPATALLATRADVFGPLQGGERGLWQGRCAVAEYAFEQTASLPLWALPEITEVLVTDRRIVYAYVRSESPDGLEVISGELRWLWPTHLRVQPGALATGRTSTPAQIQLVCAGADGSFPALVFAGGELGTVGDVDKLANLIRHAIARFRVDNAAQLGLSTPQARMLSRLLIGPEFSNYQGGDGQTANLLGSLAVHRPAGAEQPAEHAQAAYAQPAQPEADYPQFIEPQADDVQFVEPQADYAQYAAAQADYTEYDEPHADYAEPDAEYAEPHADYAEPHAGYAAPHAGYLTPHAEYAAPQAEYAAPHAGEPHPVEPEPESLLLATLHADLPQSPHHDHDHGTAEDPYPASVSGTTMRLTGHRPGLAADEARALQAAAAEQDTHLTQPDLASRAASLAARVASLVAAAEEAAEAQAAAEARAAAEAAEAQAAADWAAAELEVDTSDMPTTDLTARAERVRRAAARFAANSARGKAGVRKPEQDMGSPSRGNRTY